MAFHGAAHRLAASAWRVVALVCLLSSCQVSGARLSDLLKQPAAHILRAVSHVGQGHVVNPSSSQAESSQQEPQLNTAQVAAGEDAQPPGIEIAARQALFNYATSQGLQILRSKVQDLDIPPVSKSFNVPLIGDFTLELSEIQITQFNASSDDARLSILDEHFELLVSQVEAVITFKWHWAKLGMMGTGTGQLDLHGGAINLRFQVVTDATTAKPHVVVETAASSFASLELTIKSFSSDWLYQAVLALFNDQIQRAVQNGINSALQSDVPDALNQVLDTLPTRLDIKGLPFSTSFDYSIFTLSYVMVQGFGQYQSDSSASQLAGKAGAGVGSRVVRGDASAQGGLQGDLKGALQGGAWGAMSPCPFAATPLPLTSEEVAADGHMLSIYAHESVANCMLWGLYRGQALQYELVDGSIPHLHLTTDLLAMLMPQLPKQYPHQGVRISIAAAGEPVIAFSSVQGTTITASYRTSVYVANSTLGDPKMVTMVADLTINGDFGYDYTIIKSVTVKHTVEEATIPVAAAQWDATVTWFITNYAGLYPLSFVLNNVVHTPVTSLVALVNAQAATHDGWFQLSADVQLLEA